ncbi:MAG: polymer-forming cytoskeletal protein, partial [Caldilineaceae bacterium]|nr:polymer-forming cytoskeletal protein [Caldilineaceae bacterium]
MIKNYRTYIRMAAAVIGAVGLLVLIAGGVLYAHTAQQAPRLIVNADSESFYDDVTVESGDVHTGDIILYTGDLRVESGGTVKGAAVVYSGDITIEEGGTVAGDVVGASGDARIAGHIQGNLVIWSGDIALESSATVDGDISVMSGDIHRDRDAEIGGSIIAGPKLPEFPGLLEGFPLRAPELPVLPIGTAVERAVAPPAAPSGDLSGLTRFVLRLVAASFFTAIVVLITGLAYYLQPTFINRIRTSLTQQRPLGFVVGLLISLLLTMFMLLVLSSKSWFLAICLAPLSILALLLFLILNTGGWAALSLTVGERILAFTKMRTTQPLIPLLIGVTAMTGLLSFVWALGGCMRPVAYLAMLVLTSLGSGALIMQQMN